MDNILRNALNKGGKGAFDRHIKKCYNKIRNKLKTIMEKRLTEIRNKIILKLFVEDKLSMEDIGKIFVKTTGRIHQIIKFQKTKNLIIK